MTDFTTARNLLSTFKGDQYLHGVNILEQVGSRAAKLGQRAVLISTTFPGSDAFLKKINYALSAEGVISVANIPGPAPNAPLADLARIAKAVSVANPDLIISFGGGSTIDVAKAAEVLHTLGGDIEDYFGSNKVSQTLAESKLTMLPHVAIQTAASSAAHLTKYSNITNVQTGQKKLIVDNAIVPVQPVFD